MRDDLSLQLAQHLLLFHDVNWLVLSEAMPAEMQRLHRALHAGPLEPGPEPTKGRAWEDRSNETGAHAG